MNEEEKKLIILSLLSITITALLIGFSKGENETGSKASVNIISAEVYDSVYPYTRFDLNTAFEEAVEVELSQIKEDYIITEPGSYLLYGNYKGQICIDAEEQMVHIILKDVKIDSMSGSAINVKSAGKVVITLPEGTTNILQDNAHYRGKEDGDAVIYSICDLTVNGLGTLKVNGFYDNGIHSKDIVKIYGGEIYIKAKGDGIKGNDGISLCPVSLAVESEGNGLYTKKTGNDRKGTIDIFGGEISIICGEYAASSAQDLYVRNCSVWSKAILGPFYVSGKEYFMEECWENE